MNEAGQKILEDFSANFSEKWQRGTKEHGQIIENIEALDEAYNEVLDLVAYISLEKERQERVVALVSTLEQEINNVTEIASQCGYCNSAQGTLDVFHALCVELGMQ